MLQQFSWRAPRLGLALLCAAGGACAEGSQVPTGGHLALGTWGAVNAGVIVSETVVHVHVGCTFGDMPGMIALDAEGRFTVDGSFVLRAFPVQVGPSLPAQFSGQVVGRTLTLAIAVQDTVEGKVVALGPISVVRGREPEMGPCPICRMPKPWGAR